MGLVEAPCYLLASPASPASTLPLFSPPCPDLQTCLGASLPSFLSQASLTVCPASLYPESILSTPGSSTATGSLEVSQVSQFSLGLGKITRPIEARHD